MEMTAQNLSQDSKQLQELVLKLMGENALLLEKIRLLTAGRFGASSEKLAGVLGQLNLFGQEDGLSSDQQPEKEMVVERHTRRKPVRSPLPEDLPHQDVLHDLSDKDKICDCGAQLDRIGEEVSKKLEVEPPKAYVVRNIRPKYACKTCEGTESTGPTVKIAPAPTQILPKSYAGAGLLAYIIVAKYVDALPLHRIEKQFHRWNIKLSRKTMTDWMLKLGDKLTPLWQLLLTEVKAAPWLGMDETPIKVLNQNNKKKGLHYMWVMRSTLPKPVVLFRYHHGRGAELPRQVLTDYSGIVVTDDYKGYHFLDSPGWVQILHAACWAHARRYFIDVAKALGGVAKLKPETLTARVLKVIAQLYQLEREATDQAFTAAQRLAMRQEETRPLLENLKKMLDQAVATATPTGTLGKAVSYTLNNWSRLLVFLDHPDLPPDNNGTENSIRPYVVGRKNWLFAVSTRGAEASAILYSLVETAKANGLEPYRYFRHLLENLPDAQTEAELRGLLPTALVLN